MRIYELTCIFPTEEEQYSEGKQFVASLFEKQEVTVQKEQDLGVRDMAYVIDKKSKGKYLYYEIETSPDTISELDRSLKLSPHIIKYLFVRQEDKKTKKEKKNSTKQ